MQKMYNGEMMRVLRSFTFNGEQYVDLRNQAGEDFESVSASELGKNKPAQKKQTKKVHKIIFTKGEDKNVFKLDSPEYNKFISVRYLRTHVHRLSFSKLPRVRPYNNACIPFLPLPLYKTLS